MSNTPFELAIVAKLGMLIQGLFCVADCEERLLFVAVRFLASVAGKS